MIREVINQIKECRVWNVFGKFQSIRFQRSDICFEIFKKQKKAKTWSDSNSTIISRLNFLVSFFKYFI